MLPINVFKRLGSGAAKGTVVLYGDSIVAPTYAQWTIGFDGFTYKRRTSGAAARSQAWLSPQIGMSLYEVRATLASGDLPPGTFGVWLPMTSSYTWGWANETSQQRCHITIEIRLASTGAIVGTATINLFIAGLE
jgi:hypothetical protein